MPTRDVNLTPELDRFVEASIESGRYEDASEVIRAALRNLERDERDERECELKLSSLRTAIDEGDTSGLATGDVFQRVRADVILSDTERSAGESKDLRFNRG